MASKERFSLNSSDSKLPGQDRRRFSRIPMGVSILFPHLQKKLICHNLSKTGCFFPDSDLGPVGETISLMIDPPEIGLIPVEARIVHKGKDGMGSGLQFMALDPEMEVKLSDFLDIFES
jgi:hypothetical protein